MTKKFQRATAFLLALQLCTAMMPTSGAIAAQNPAPTPLTDVAVVQQNPLVPAVTATGYEQTTLTWDAVDGATDYQIFRARGTGAFTELAQTAQTNYVDDTLASDTRYTYRVDYTDAQGESVTGTAVQMEDLADLAALQREAVVSYDLLDAIFDGQSTLDKSADLPKLANLTEGSVVMRAKFTGTPADSMQALFSLTGDSDSNKDIAIGIIEGEVISEARYHMGSGLKSYMGKRGEDMADGQWHTYILTMEGNATKVCVDGKSEVGNFDKAGYGGFLTRAGDATAFTLGGGDGVENWQGQIAYITITDQILTPEQMVEITTASNSANDLAGLLDGSPDNTWVFTGADAIKSDVESIGGARTFVGHFEEYIRWAIGSTTPSTRQRFVFSTAPAEGIALSTLNAEFDANIGAYQPKAVAIMVDDQDFDTEINDLQADLQGIVDQIYALEAVPVLITPYATQDADTNEKVENIVDMLEQTARANRSGDQEILVVDLYEDTDTDHLNADDTLNAQGHYAAGAALVKAVTGDTMQYAGFGTEESVTLPQAVQVAPVVSTTAEAIAVTLPAGYTQAKYSCTVGQTTRSGALTDTLTLANLTAGEDFTLEVQATTAEGVLHALQLVTGTVGGDISTTATAPQAGILAGEDAPTILFVGDSITHGAQHTYGYASVPQLFERALTEVGMGDSVVLNVGVSSANAGDDANGTLHADAKPYRLDRYLDADGVLADIVVIMLGMNDCVASGMTTAKFKDNLETILEQVEDAGATAVLRTPNPINASTGNRQANLPAYVACIREVAEEQDILLVDHYAEWTAKLQGDMPAIINDSSNKVWLNDGLHPNPSGQLDLFNSLFTAVAGTELAQQTSLSTLTYAYDTVQTKGDNLAQYITANADGFTLDTALLQERTTQNLEDVTMQLEANGQTIAVNTQDFTQTIAIDGLQSQTAYAVTVHATYAAGNNKGYQLAFEDVLLYTGADVADGTDLTFTMTAQPPYAVGDTMGTLTYTQQNTVQEDAVFTLVDTATCSDNLYFTIEGNRLQIANPITAGRSYQIKVQAQANGTQDTLILFVETTQQANIIYQNSGLRLENVAQATALSAEQLEAAKAAQNMTIVVEFSQENSEFGALFSLSNANTGASYFALIVKGNELVLEHRESGRDDINNKVGGDWPTHLAAGEINTVALRATENQGYDFFVNGALVQQVAMDADSYRAPAEIAGVNTSYVGKTHRSTAANGYPMLGNIYEIQVYDAALDDATLLERTAKTAKMPSYKDDFINVYEAYRSEYNPTQDKAANAGSNYFRIPSLLVTEQGTTVTATDLRYGGTGDSANNLDIGVRTKDAGASTWNDVIRPAYFDDFSDADHIMQLGSNSYAYNKKSASFIDPVLVEDTMHQESRIFMITDAFTSGGGAGSHSYVRPQNTIGNGFVEIDGKSYWKLKKTGESDYNYYVDAVNLDADGMRTIYRMDDNSPLTDYKLNANFEVVLDGVVQTVAQRSTTYDYNSNTMTENGLSGEQVAMNIMYSPPDATSVPQCTSTFTVYPTMYMYLFYSDDQGKTWSHPTNISGMVKPEDYGFYGVGPGVGIQLTQGEHAGRILVPTYTIINGSETNCAIYSDDGGVTWHKGELVALANGVERMSESQYVELPDGSIRVYSRTEGSYVGYATSLDGGETWTPAQYDTTLPHINSSGCQISVINYSKEIDGYPAVVFSGPTGSSRTNGVIRIGLVQDTGAQGAEKYEIVWRYEEKITTYDPNRPASDPTYGRGNNFAYSCLGELPNGDIGIIYETHNMRQPLEDSMRYAEYTMEHLMDTVIDGSATVTPAYAVDYTEQDGTYHFDLAVVYDAAVRLIGDAGMTLTDGTTTYNAIYMGTTDNKTYTFRAQVPAGSYTVRYNNPHATSEKGIVVTQILGDYVVGDVTYEVHDLNQDGVVDALDLALAKTYYRATATRSNWEQAKIADVNGDELVNIADFVLILLHYTQSNTVNAR